MKWVAFISFCFGASAQIVQTPLTTSTNPAVARAWLEIPAQPSPVTNVEVVTEPYSLVREWYSLRFQTRLEHDRLLRGKGDTNKHWMFWDGTNVNSNCWAYPINWSGMSLGGTMVTCAITERHGVTAAHVGPAIGSELRFRSQAGEWVTNWVAATTNSDWIWKLSLSAMLSPLRLCPFQ